MRTSITLLSLSAGSLLGASADAAPVAPSDEDPVRLEASDGADFDGFGSAVDLDASLLAAVGYRSAYVYAGGGSGWAETRLLPLDDVSASLFEDVAVSGDTVVVGAPGDDERAEDAGAVYVFVRSGTVWQQQAKLFSADAAGYHELGTSVALQGDTLVAGAPGVTSDTGAVYVFVRSGTTWTQQAKLIPAGVFPSSFVGTDVAFESDTLLTGAPAVDGPSADSGAGYVFVRSGTTWTQQAHLTAVGAGQGASMGTAVSLSGNTALLGAPRERAAFVFVRDGTTWSEQAELRPDAYVLDGFELSVALDGDVAVIGDERHRTVEFAAGAAFLYRRSGDAWHPEGRLAVGTTRRDSRFGSSIAIDDGTLAVGAEGWVSLQGSVYVGPLPVKPEQPFTVEEAQLRSSTPQPEDRFGLDVDVSGDTLITGTPRDFGDDRGSASVFRRSAGTWIEEALLEGSDVGGGEKFGRAVAVDGDTAIVGVPFDNNVNGVQAGAAYVFVRSGTTWTEQVKLLAPSGSGQNLDWFGWAVDIDLDTLAITTQLGGNQGGSIFVFKRSGTVWTIEQEIVPSSVIADFGARVALSGDHVASITPLDPGGGLVFAYERTGTTWGSEAIFRAAGTTANDRFGTDLDMDGDTLLVGAPGHGLPFLDSGSAYVFEWDGTAWNETQELRPSGPAWGDRPSGGFGAAVGLDGTTAVIAASHFEGDALIYGFTHDGSTWTQQTRMVASGGCFDDVPAITLALDGSVAAVGLPQDDALAVDAGAALAFDPLGSPFQSFCTAVANSSGLPAAITASGSNSVFANDLVFTVVDLPPNQSGLVIYSPDQASVPLGNGTLCLGSRTQGFVNRLPPTTSDGTGTLVHALDVTAPPTPESLIVPGSTWNFSCWFRDVPAGGAFFNFSDGVEVRFAP